MSIHELPEDLKQQMMNPPTELPEDLKERYAHIPWKQIAGSGNIFRHDYEDVLERIVWDTVHTALDPLEDVVKKELEKF